MSKLTRLVPWGLAASLLILGPVSQTPVAARRTADSAAVSLRQSAGVVAIEGGAIAHGPGYEARLVGGGVEFLPVLGHRAPRNLPLRFEFDSVWRGTELIASADQHLPAPTITKGSLIWARDGGMFERYEARREGLEQSFEFREPIAGTGELIVRGRLTTPMPGERQTDGSLLFREPGVGGVQIGVVTGVDALGRTTPGSLHRHGDMLELTLPASFVDSAAWPLVLDPLIGTWFDPTFGSTWDDITPDVAYDASNDVYLMVWERVFSATSSGTRGQRIDGAGNQVGSTIFFTVGAGRYTRPRVCNVNAVDRFLTTWLAPGPSGTQVLEASAVSAMGGTFSAPVVLVSPTFLGQPRSVESPCLAGDLSTSNQGALLVYHVTAGSSAVYAARVDVLPTGNPTIQTGNTHALWTGITTTPYGLSMSKTGGSAGRYVVALSYANLQAVAVDRNALPIGTPAVVASHTNGRNFNPAVDGTGSDFLCVWEKERGSGAADRDILCAALQASASGLTVAPGTARISDRNSTGNSFGDPDLVFLGGKYAVCFRHAYPTLPNGDDIRLAILNPDCSVCGPLFYAFGPYTVSLDSGNRLIAKRSGALGANDEALLVWADLLPAADSDLRAQRLESRSQGQSPIQIAPGCGTGGVAGTTGSGFVFGNQSFALTVNNAAPNASLFCSLGFTTSPVVCGSCQILQPVLVDFVPNNAGSGVRPLPVPCDGGLLDAQLQFQWISINTPTSPCPIVTGLATSAILQLRLVP